jgi:hypothetical protein
VPEGDPPPLEADEAEAEEPGRPPVRGPRVTLEEVKKHLTRVLTHFEEGRWQLLGILHSLPEPLVEQSGLEDAADTVDPATDLRTTIECVLEDYIRPALRDLHDVLEGTADQEEQGEAP